MCPRIRSVGSMTCSASRRCFIRILRMSTRFGPRAHAPSFSASLYLCLRRRRPRRPSARSCVRAWHLTTRDSVSTGSGSSKVETAASFHCRPSVFGLSMTSSIWRPSPRRAFERRSRHAWTCGSTRSLMPRRQPTTLTCETFVASRSRSMWE